MKLGDNVIAGNRKGFLVQTESYTPCGKPYRLGVTFVKNFDDWTGLQRIVMFKPEQVKAPPAKPNESFLR